MVDAEG